MHKVYYNPGNPSSFSTLHKLESAVKKKAPVAKWLLGQDAYTLHKPVRKRFVRNPYFVTNIGDVMELDLVDMQAYAKYNDKYKYLLNAIDLFSRYAHSVPIKAKTGVAVTEAFATIVDSMPPPLTVQTDKGKEFVNKTFQTYLKERNIHFQTCRNPVVKCSMVERFNRTLKTKMFKYFTYKNSYRYVDVLGKFVHAYNNSVHSSIGMKPADVSVSHVLQLWRRKGGRAQSETTSKPVRFHEGQTVRISKDKMLFAKGYEHNYSTEIFRVVKVIRRRPQPVYELVDMNDTPIDGQFYNEELTPVLIGKKTEYKIDKIIDTRGKGRTLEYLVRWRGYGPEFDSWVPASTIKRI